MKKLALLLGVAYPFVVFTIFYWVSESDPFGIFDETYLMGMGVALPAAILTLSVILIRRGEGAFWLPVILMAVWITGVTMAHFWAVAQLAAGV